MVHSGPVGASIPSGSEDGGAANRPTLEEVWPILKAVAFAEGDAYALRGDRYANRLRVELIRRNA